ncbi:hypothetical protein FIBSPDRAFT_914053 [Athelia psychrophila]|uniref:RING-type domain-containing protein n=1 Tax=Athelia psychrophila TaxID=1759441 RepID=A0A165YH65_9AGAM|nr:hypothetical protein FIBSPDRAFT_914053 [Fibularhizoctonia sp. CBS 109695]
MSDFDSSYESLMTLASTLGEVRPRSTPSDVIASLPTGTYQDWRTPGSDERCPICLDDYQPSDPMLKLTDCSHWLHKDCLQQWLHGANTCPVCRKRVNGRNARRAAGEEPSPRSGGSSNNRHNDPDFGFGTPPWRMYE